MNPLAIVDITVDITIPAMPAGVRPIAHLWEHAGGWELELAHGNAVAGYTVFWRHWYTTKANALQSARNANATPWNY